MKNATVEISLSKYVYTSYTVPTDQERLQKIQHYIGPLAGKNRTCVDPLVQRSNRAKNLSSYLLWRNYSQ
jgi:hypothetical protein